VVALDVTVDEGAERQHRQLPLPRIVEREGNQLAAQPLALEAVVDLGVGEGQQAGPGPVLREPRKLVADTHLKALLIRVVGEGYRGLGAHADIVTAPCARFALAPSGYPSLRQDQGSKQEERMDTKADRGGIGGISVGGILVIIGIVVMLVWSFWIGLIVTLVGLIAFGGFARGKWY
jgi:hypothetical protein